MSPDKETCENAKYLPQLDWTLAGLEPASLSAQSPCDVRLHQCVKPHNYQGHFSASEWALRVLPLARLIQTAPLPKSGRVVPVFRSRLSLGNSLKITQLDF